MWGDNTIKEYAIFLQHCPEELQTELKNQEVWTAIDNARRVVWIIFLIRDLQYHKSDRKRSIMTTAEADFDLYSCAQGGKTTDEYPKIFASTVDTNNVNGGNAGLHTPLRLQEILPTHEI